MCNDETSPLADQSLHSCHSNTAVRPQVAALKQEACRHVSLERYALAQNILAEALKLDPDSADLHELIAAVQIENGDFTAAIASASRTQHAAPHPSQRR